MTDKPKDGKSNVHTKRMMIALNYPRKKHHLFMDEKSQDFIHRIEKEIGLKAIVSDWDHPLMTVDYFYPLFWNPEMEGYAHVSQKESSWLVQVSIMVDGEQYDVVRHQFSRLPFASDILLANTINQIYAFFRSRTSQLSFSYCWDCGTLYHWTESKGTLEDKWRSLKEQRCEECL